VVTDAGVKVEWSNPADPSKGFKYLYLSDSDYVRLTTVGADAVKVSALSSDAVH
jgi:hypothetical protein